MPNDWKRGLPPGEYYEGMVEDFEVYFTVGGVKWHRKRTPEERTNYIAAREANHRAANLFRKSPQFQRCCHASPW